MEFKTNQIRKRDARARTSLQETNLMFVYVLILVFVYWSHMLHQIMLILHIRTMQQNHTP